MSNLRHTTVVGRLGANPELVTPKDTEIAKFSVAVNQYNPETKAEETVWVKCSAFDKQKDYVMANLKDGKGAMVWVTGVHTVYEGTSGPQDQLNVKGIGVAGNFFTPDDDSDPAGW